MSDKILVPMDGSVEALRALQHAGARRRAATGKVSLLVLNVQSPLPPSRYVTRSMLKDHHARMSIEALRGARSMARRLALDARFYVRRGEPAATISRFAQRMGCGEIIMGTRGRGRTAIFVLGSVALRVVQLVRTPVTLVK
jgi:nucleotide-binding universal stress UspA family protein